MPKIIRNLRENLLKETRKMLLKNGYDAVTIRGIASTCGAATGTVYNYFPSKEALIAHAILGDWLDHVTHAREKLAITSDVRKGLAIILECIGDFSRRYRATFRQSGITLAGSAYTERHDMLCDQIIDLIRVLEERFACAPSATAEKVMAESLLSGASHDWPEEELLPLLEKLIS